MGLLASKLEALIGANMKFFTTTFFVTGGLLTVLTKAVPALVQNRWPVIYEIFHCNWSWVILRIAGAVFSLMTFFALGPLWAIGPETGQVAFVQVAGIIFLLIGLGCLLLPLLTDYGFMEFAGTLFRKPFKLIFNLPGRATIDTLASWLGASSIAVLVTSRQYASGFYTAREAAVIATNFSVVSVPFVLLIAKVAGIQDQFLLLYGTMVLIGFICAILLPKFPPLSRIADKYYEPVGRQVPERSEQVGIWRLAWSSAVKRAGSAPSIQLLVAAGFRAILDLFLTVMPAGMTVMFAALTLYHHTDFLQLVTYPLVPVLEALQVPEARLAAPGVVVGLLDQFVPAVIAGSIDSPVTSFVLAGLSVTQLIFFAENAVLILRSKIPISVPQLIAIFVLRTCIALPILALVANWQLR